MNAGKTGIITRTTQYLGSRPQYVAVRAAMEPVGPPGRLLNPEKEVLRIAVGKWLLESRQIGKFSIKLFSRAHDVVGDGIHPPFVNDAVVGQLCGIITKVNF